MKEKHTCCSSVSFNIIHQDKDNLLVHLIQHNPSRRRLHARHLQLFSHRSLPLHCGASYPSYSSFAFAVLSIMLQGPHLYHLRRLVRFGLPVGNFRVASHCHEYHQVVPKLPGRCFLDLSKVNGSLALVLCLGIYQTAASAHIRV